MSPQSEPKDNDGPLTMEFEKKTMLPKKVYVPRNSVLTNLMEVNHLQTVYNISVAIFNLFLLNACIYYLAAPHKFWSDVSIMLWAADNPAYFVAMWLSFNAFALAVLQGFKAWVSLRRAINSKVADVLFLFLYWHALGLMFVGTTYTVLQYPIRPITNFAIMCEQVRIFMKVYSFVRESVPRVLKYKPAKDGSQEQALCPSTAHYVYFLFVPALIYRDAYPKKEGSVCWRFVLRQLFTFFACIFLTYCVFMRFIVDVFGRVGRVQIPLAEAALIMAGCMAVGSMMMFLMFYGILHSWLNVFAELTRFGDREFYQDWWNSTSFSQYYRRWNAVVYDWLYAYVYVEIHNLGLNRSLSMISVFLMSALVHEYIIALSMGYFYPVLMVTYSTMGIVVIFITKKRTTQFWNTFMWFMLFSGWGVVVCLYALEWYARNNCFVHTDPWRNFFVPSSWLQSCRVLDYS